MVLLINGAITLTCHRLEYAADVLIADSVVPEILSPIKFGINLFCKIEMVKPFTVVDRYVHVFASLFALVMPVSMLFSAAGVIGVLPSEPDCQPPE